MHDVKIIDDILDENFVDYIEKSFHDDLIDWYFNRGTVVPGKDKNILENTNTKELSQFTHMLLGNNGEVSKFRFLGDEVLDNFTKVFPLEYKSVLRMKANLAVPMPHNLTNDKFHNTPHIDHDVKHLVMIYYVNDSDGDTIIFDKKNTDKILEKVTPKKGRFVIFNGDNYHAGRQPKNFETRVIINYNLEI